jgi:hypothetical protein
VFEHARVPVGDEGVKGSERVITFDVLERVVGLRDVQDTEPCLIFRIGSCVVLYILIFFHLENLNYMRFLPM